MSRGIDERNWISVLKLLLLYPRVEVLDGKWSLVLYTYLRLLVG